MKTIPLTNSELMAQVDDEDYQYISQFRWQINPETGYAQRCVRVMGRITTVLMARQIMGEPDCKVDHRNHDRLDNQKLNLRLCDRSQNGANRIKSLCPSSSKYKGVHRLKSGGKFQARAGRSYLGTFENEIDAARAYNSKAVELFGEFALINEI